MAWRSDGKIVIAYQQGPLEVRDSQNRVLWSIADVGGSKVVWDPNIQDNKLAVMFTYKRGIGTAIQLFDADTGNLVQTLFPDGQSLFDIDWSSDGKWIAGTVVDEFGSSEQRFIEVWNANTGIIKCSFLKSHTPLFSIAWRPNNDSQLAVGSATGTVNVLNLMTGQDINLNAVDRSDFGTASISWSPNGTQLAAASLVCSCASETLTGGTPPSTDHPLPDGVIRIWDTSNFNLIKDIDDADIGIGAQLRWSPDGNHLALNNISSIQFFDPRTDFLLSKYMLTNQLFDAFAWSPNSKRLILAYHANPSTITEEPNGNQAASTNKLLFINAP